LISKSPLICSQKCPPKRGAKPRARRLIQYGAIIPFRSNLLYQKLLKITRPTPRLRAPQAGQATPAKFLFFLMGTRNFYFKESFCGHCFCADAQAKPLPPLSRLRREAGGQKFPPPDPVPFCPPAGEAVFWRRRDYFFEDRKKKKRCACPTLPCAHIDSLKPVSTDELDKLLTRLLYLCYCFNTVKQCYGKTANDKAGDRTY